MAPSAEHTGGPPRIAPLQDDEMDAATQELLRGPSQLSVPASNVFSTLVRNRRVFRHWAPFAARLLDGKLGRRRIELVILRVAWRCESEYEWGQHVRLGRAAGVTDTEITRLRQVPLDGGFDELDGALVSAVDELHDSHTISDATWEILVRHLDEERLIELLMLIGNYHMLAFALNTLRVQREPGVPGFEP